MSRRVLVVGDIVTDIVAVHSGVLAVDSDTPARITATAGGSAANTAAWLADAGVAVSLLGVVGADAAGAQLIAELAAAGVDCSPVVHSPTTPTGTIIVLTDGRNRTMVADRGANHDLRPGWVDDSFAGLPDLAHLHLSGYTLLHASSRGAGLRALELARARGIPTSVDAASAAPLREHARALLDWVAGVDLLLANLDEARILAVAADSTVDDAPAAVAAVLARTVGEVVVKLGPGGALWTRADQTRVVAAEPATVVDTTGAGDAFAAGLIAARLAGTGIDASLAEAVRLGTAAVGLLGGRPPAAPQQSTARPARLSRDR
jgi:sugar/nucleoside kinase (ribokinase family)